VDFRADLYALGVVAYEMLVGTPPFHGRAPQAILAAHISEAPTPLAARRYDVPVALADLVMQCLAKDPARRPKSAQEIARILDSPEVVSGTFAVPPASPGRRTRRRVALATGAAILLAAAAVARWWPSPTATDDAGSAVPPPAAAAPLALPAPPLGSSIAVLPFAAAGGDARARGIASGLTADVGYALSRVPGLRVAARSNALAVPRDSASPAPSPDSNATAAPVPIDVSMLVDGSVQRVGERLRVTVRLSRVARDSVVWVERFEGPVSAALAMQDSVSRALVGAITSRREPPRTP
jgi:serine/threonine-protein kinase